MNIRQATRDDVDAMHVLGAAAPEFAVNAQTVDFWPKAVLARAVASDDVLVLVAEEAQELAGFLIVNYNKSLKKALIENIFVRPDMRGQRIGDTLLAHMFELLPGMGCEYVAALVPPDADGAISLYRHHGFSQGNIFVWLDKALADTFKH